MAFLDRYYYLGMLYIHRKIAIKTTLVWTLFFIQNEIRVRLDFTNDLPLQYHDSGSRTIDSYSYYLLKLNQILGIFAASNSLSLLASSKATVVPSSYLFFWRFAWSPFFSSASF